MKVVDGKFGKKEEEMSLQEKLALTMASMLDGSENGNFVLLMDTGQDDVIMIASDMIAPDMVYLLESAKMNILLGAGDDMTVPTTH